MQRSRPPPRRRPVLETPCGRSRRVAQFRPAGARFPQLRGGCCKGAGARVNPAIPGDRATIATVRLGVVEGQVCADHHIRNRLVRGGGCDPYAHGQTDALMRAAGRRLAHDAADLFGKRLCLLFSVVRQDDAEFLSSDPSENAPTCEERRDGVGKVRECHVAAGVPVLIIDLLEKIEVEQQEGSRPSRVRHSAKICSPSSMSAPRDSAPVSPSRAIAALNAAMMRACIVRITAMKTSGRQSACMVTTKKSNRMKPGEPDRSAVKWDDGPRI